MGGGARVVVSAVFTGGTGAIPHSKGWPATTCCSRPLHNFVFSVSGEPLSAKKPMRQRLLQWLDRVLSEIRQRMNRGQTPRVVIITAPSANRQNQGAMPGQIQPPIGNDGMPRHAAEEHVRFRPIGGEGVLVEQSEEWHRDGATMRTTMKRTLVVTCSGEVTPSSKIKALCSQCGGYTSVLTRCNACSKTLCETCARVFNDPRGRLVLCDQHFRMAVESFDTWAARDIARTSRKS